MENLFQEFGATDATKWIEKIHADLKGKSADILSFEPEKELSVQSFYHRSAFPEGHFATSRNTNDWKNRRRYFESSNQRILDDLNQGIDCLGLVYQNQSNFDELTKDVQFEYINADVYFKDIQGAKTFKGHSSIRLNFDIFERGITCGEWLCQPTEFVQFFSAQSAHQTIWVSGNKYGEAGASTVQELAFTANHLNEYMQLLVDSGISLEEINSKIVVELSVTNDYFVNIAKFKVLRKMVRAIFKGYDPAYQAKPITVYATTSSRYLAFNDTNNNLLRQTTEAMSAIIGGCDVLTVQPLQYTDSDKIDLYNRMAKNISLVLKEESYLDKVSDPGEGAYYLEMLCEQIIDKSWELFNSVEKAGGFIKAIETNYIQRIISENRNYLIERINSGKITFLGVNKYPSTLEEWTVIKDTINNGAVTFEPLHIFKLEEHFKKSIHEQSNV